MSTETTTPTTSSIDHDPDADGGEQHWRVEAEGMSLARTSYNTYELGYQSLAVTFDDVRYDEDDEEYTLRDGHDAQGRFDPEAEDVPEAIAVAFTVLADTI